MDVPIRIHVATLAGLTDDTRYYYAVGGNASDVRAFTAARMMALPSGVFFLRPATDGWPPGILERALGAAAEGGGAAGRASKAEETLRRLRIC